MRKKEHTKERANRHTKEHTKKKRQKKQKYDVVSITILLVALSVFIITLYQLVMMLVPYFSGKEEYEAVKDKVIIENVVAKGEKTEEQHRMFRVDFQALKAQNPDTIAWIRFDEPSIISYPVVKSADNVEYLTRTFTAKDNKLGAIFMDMRNQNDFSNRNTIIYGHNMKIGGDMFSQLPEYADEEFYKKHPYFYIYTPDGKVRTYEIFSASVVKETSDQYQINFGSNEEYEAFLDKCHNHSNYSTDVKLTPETKIVSLSTCTNVNQDERFLVQGAMIKEEMIEELEKNKEE